MLNIIYAECLTKPFMLTVVKLNVIMLNVAVPFLPHKLKVYFLSFLVIIFFEKIC
jgi:hypothetical protein